MPKEKDIETRIATLERQMIDLSRKINQQQTAAVQPVQKFAAGQKTKRVSLDNGTTVDVTFHQQWVEKNLVPNPLMPGKFVTLDETFENPEIMAYWATQKSPAYTTLNPVNS